MTAGIAIKRAAGRWLAAMVGLCLSLGGLGVPAAGASTGRGLELSSDLMVESVAADARGTRRLALQEAAVVSPGDRVVYLITYRNPGGPIPRGAAIVNALPPRVRLAGIASDAVQVSVDGGRSWGRLGTLAIRGPDGPRPAAQDDVTHLRWDLPGPIRPGEQGVLSFRGVVQ